MADEFDDNDDENFDKPDPKAQLNRAAKKDEKGDEFEEEQEDDLEDLEVEIAEDEEGDTKLANKRGNDKFKSQSEEGRLGRRRQKFKPRESRVIRELETKLNEERVRNDDLAERLSAVESNTTQISDNNIDTQISEATRYLETAKRAHATAVKDGDGDAAAEALDVMMEAKETVTLLKASKKVTPSSREKPITEDKPITGKREVPKPDPAVLRMFDQWHENNDWYDPALRDKHSRIAFHIDNALNAEGYDPRSREYWEEFDARCRENPTLAKDVFDNEEDEGERRMTKPTKREASPSKRSAPLNERSGSGGSSKKIVVSRQRADAMKEMGLQPGTPEWKRMAKKYEAYDKQRSA